MRGWIGGERAGRRRREGVEGERDELGSFSCIRYGGGLGTHLSTVWKGGGTKSPDAKTGLDSRCHNEELKMKIVTRWQRQAAACVKAAWAR